MNCNKQEFIIIKARVIDFDRETCIAKVKTTDQKTKRFHSTSFSSRPPRFPECGDKVQLIVDTETKEIVRVRLDSK